MTTTESTDDTIARSAGDVVAALLQCHDAATLRAIHQELSTQLSARDIISTPQRDTEKMIDGWLSRNYRDNPHGHSG